MKPLHEVAEHYFNTLNPIAERISADIVAIKDAYEDLWTCLNIKEKHQIINETVVHPEAVLKYALTAKSCDGVSLDIPLLTHQVTGSKYIVDESTGLSWRDEHSGPFSWKTPSQIDLSLFTSTKGEIQPEKKYHAVNNNNNSHSNNNNNNNNNNESKENCFGLSETDDAYSDITNTEKYSNKKVNKKKAPTPFSSNNVVLVGTCSKLSGLCSKLKFLPGKSYSYEVQTVVSNPANDGSFLDKLKTTAVFKFQNTFKLVSGKNNVEKKAEEYKETETLVQPKGTAAVVRLSKPSPKISKPKSPPPPPPNASMAAKMSEDKIDNKTAKNLILVRNSRIDNCQDERDSEKATLLGENSVQSFLSGDRDSSDQEVQSKVTYEFSDEFNSVSTECTPLSGPSTEVIPKSGFDFLDNW